MTEYAILRSDSVDPHEQQLRAAYFALRSRAFEAMWHGTLYPNGPDQLDQRPDTTYILRIEEGHVVGGGRLLLHPAHSGATISMDKHFPEFSPARMLPHHDTEAMDYAEMGGGVADPDIKYRELHIGTSLLREGMRAVREGKVTCDGRPITALLATCTSGSIAGLKHALGEVGMDGIVRIDAIQKEKNLKFNTKLWPVVIAAQPDFDLKPDQHAVLLSQYKVPERGRRAGS